MGIILGCKISAVVIAIVNLIGAIKMAKISAAFMAMVEYDYDSHFDIMTFLTVLIPGLIAALAIYAIGEILTRTYTLEDRICSLEHDKSESTTTAGLSTADVKSQYQKTSYNQEGATWVCSKCGQVNPNSAISCKGCGEYR